MKIHHMPVLLIPFILFAQAPRDALPVDIRQRVLGDNQIQTVVEIRNETGRIITRLDGYLYATTLSGKSVPERHMQFIAPYETLSNGMSHSETSLYTLDPMDPWDFQFHFSHIEFRDDPKVYTYDPKVGFIRIE